MKKISVSIAMPHEGEDVEHLNLELFEKNIVTELKITFPDCPVVLVNVFDHDGTGEDEIYHPKSDDDEYDYFASALADAISSAFSDETSYVDETAPTRNFTLRIRLTDAEHAQLQAAADQAGQTMSEYVRRKIF